ncbi:hypothetical protein EG328_006283 [Venturia inaequalis]|uniref:Uncharacterized protein n=1 Tax=Venturia inaequalis TaxID=5025 RepID=A0A8H3UH27_VENIN|nr:hypothetical protein EG328_006283 [Venturia inaequalis]
MSASSDRYRVWTEDFVNKAGPFFNSHARSSFASHEEAYVFTSSFSNFQERVIIDIHFSMIYIRIVINGTRYRWQCNYCSYTKPFKLHANCSHLHLRLSISTHACHLENDAVARDEDLERAQRKEWLLANDEQPEEDIEDALERRFIGIKVWSE